MEQPRGSFRTLGGKWFVACWECKKGINGKQTCSKGVKSKNLKEGCHEGELLDKYKEE